MEKETYNDERWYFLCRDLTYLVPISAKYKINESDNKNVFSIDFGSDGEMPDRIIVNPSLRIIYVSNNRRIQEAELIRDAYKRAFGLEYHIDYQVQYH
ncbi:MAG: hypothetical protein QXI33_02600 [Candidatus Pacearchaeota archaeon]